MPTGYTAGILDGSIENFEQFATTCMRAFGATIHMRDADHDTKYEPRVPSDHHHIRLAGSLTRMEDILNMSDLDIKEAEVTRITEDVKRYEENIVKCTEHRNKLNKILAKVVSWKEPTSEHTKFKEFMVNQLNDTIKHDGDDSYYITQISELNSINIDLSIDKIRKDMIASAQWSIDYHTKEGKADIERCDDSNKWVSDLVDSIK